MALRVGINGFGRIGRLVFRVLAERPSDFDVVAINDLSDPKHLALLLKYDSVQGRFKGTVTAREQSIVVNGKDIPITTEKDPADLPWKKLGCQVALESTGRFTNRASLQKHIDAGAERVDLQRPGQGRPGRHDRAGRQRQDLDQEPPHHLQRVVHDKLLGPARQGFARKLWHRKRTDDDGSCLHERSARRRPGARRSISCPRGRGQHHSLQDRRGESRRRGHPGTQGQAHRLRAPRARARRLGRRPDGPAQNERDP